MYLHFNIWEYSIAPCVNHSRDISSLLQINILQNTSVSFGDRGREIAATVFGLKNIRRLPWLQCLHFIYTVSPPVDKNFVSSQINREEMVVETITKSNWET